MEIAHLAIQRAENGWLLHWSAKVTTPTAAAGKDHMEVFDSDSALGLRILDLLGIGKKAEAQ